MSTPTISPTTSRPPRRSWRHARGSASAFGKSIPDRLPAALTAPFKELRERIDQLAALKASHAALLQSRDAWRDARQRAIEDNTRGLIPENEIPEDRERAFEIEISDTEHRLAVASRMVRDADAAILADASAYADDIADENAEAIDRARGKALKSLATFERDLLAYREAQATSSWASALAQGVASPYVSPPAPEALAVLSDLLEGADRARADRAKVEQFIDQIGIANVLKPQQVASVNPHLWMPRHIANQLGVDLETVKAVLKERQRG